MPSIGAVAKRGLRDTLWGKALLLLAVLLAAVVVAQSCGSRETEVSKEEATEIAREQVDYDPNRVQTRFVPRGIESRPAWAVSLGVTDGAGAFSRLTVVVVDAATGQVVEIREQG
jgi:hypothetical protein